MAVRVAGGAEENVFYVYCIPPAMLAVNVTSSAEAKKQQKKLGKQTEAGKAAEIPADVGDQGAAKMSSKGAAEGTDDNGLGYLAGTIVGGRYQLCKPISSGSFGTIFDSVDITTGERVAAKVEIAGTGPNNMLQNESVVLQRTAAISGFAALKWFGSEQGTNVLVMERLGPSLGSLWRSCKNVFTLKTIYMLADQCLTLLQKLHHVGLIHGDVKPENFVVGYPEELRNRVYLIDFGLTRDFKTVSGRHVKAKTGVSFAGTPRYASINTHRGFEPSRRDDLESLGYMLLYFVKGSLPWNGVCQNGISVKETILQIKQQTSIKSLCKGLPQCFADYMKYCRNLEYAQEPRYDYLRLLFHNEMYKLNLSFDYEFEWTKAKPKPKPPSTTVHYVPHPYVPCAFHKPLTQIPAIPAVPQAHVIKTIYYFPPASGYHHPFTLSPYQVQQVGAEDDQALAA